MVVLGFLAWITGQMNRFLYDLYVPNISSRSVVKVEPR